MGDLTTIAFTLSTVDILLFVRYTRQVGVIAGLDVLSPSPPEVKTTGKSAREFLSVELAGSRFEPVPDSWLTGVDPRFGDDNE